MQLLAFLQDETLLGSVGREAGGSLENINSGTFGTWFLLVAMHIYIYIY